MKHSLDQLINACPDRYRVASDSVELADQRSLGPVSQQVLHNAGITSVNQLREMGSVAAYINVKKAGAQVSLNLLWILEGLVSGLPWRIVEQKHRHRLLVSLGRMERDT